MKSFNQVILLGNLGKNPKVLKEENSFAQLSMATTKKYKNAKGELQEITQWHRVYVSNGTGKAAMEYLKKGSRVHVIGELQEREWYDKKGGRHFETAVYASSVIFLDHKSPEKSSEPDVSFVENVAEITDQPPF
jgi:single-strand DNA-binding protein